METTVDKSGYRIPWEDNDDLVFLPEEYKRDKIIRGKEHVKNTNNTEK